MMDLGRLLSGLALFASAVQCPCMRYGPAFVVAGLLAASAGGVAALAWWRAGQPTNPLTAGAGTVISVLDTSQPFSLEPPPPGWRHRTFWRVPPMRLSFATADGVPALRCETNASGSIYGRHTDIDLARFPRLDWRWNVEVPISSERDERTREGDDHPVRFFLEFADTAGTRHRMEIIWANRAFKRGDWKYIGTFPHYVADGGLENTGRWRDETVDLLELYRTFTRRTDTPRLTFLAVFCDSDDTGDRSIAYTSSVRLLSR